MGQDKALIRVDGTAMALRVAEALRAAGAAEVAAVGGDRHGLQAAGLAYREDRWPGEGPLGGIISALGSVGRSNEVAVLACDLLHPSAELIRELTTVRRSSDADLAVPVYAGRHQWTHGIWHRRTLDALASGFESGVRSLHEAAAGLVVVTIEADESSTADADRPEDLPR